MDPRLNSRPWVKWYKTAAWLRLRRSHLSKNPLCKFCFKAGIIKEANTVDHVTPHKGDMKKFFNKGNLQSLCHSCHSSTKQKLEKSGEFGGNEMGIGKNWE